MRRRNRGDEELAAVGILASIGHGKKASALVLELEVFVRELRTIDGLAASTVTIGKITTLNHEILDDAVEFGSLVTESFLARTERPEVFCSFGYLLAIEAHDDAARRFSSNRNIEIHLMGNHRPPC